MEGNQITVWYSFYSTLTGTSQWDPDPPSFTWLGIIYHENDASSKETVLAELINQPEKKYKSDF